MLILPYKIAECQVDADNRSNGYRYNGSSKVNSCKDTIFPLYHKIIIGNFNPKKYKEIYNVGINRLSEHGEVSDL